MLKESLLAAALALPAWHGDKESDGDRQARLAVIAQAIDDAVALATCRENATPKGGPSEKSEKSVDARPSADAPAPAGEPKVSDEKAPAAATAKPAESPLTASKASPEGAEGERAGSDSSGKPCKKIWSGTQRELGFLLLAQAFFETRLALHVHEGNCRKEIGECDSGRAVSLWQLHAGYRLPVERWRTLAGTDLESTRDAAVEAARALSRSKNFCGTTEGAVANYATGKGCVWKPAEERVRMAQELTQKFWRKKARATEPPPKPDAVSEAPPKHPGAHVAAAAAANPPPPGS